MNVTKKNILLSDTKKKGTKKKYLAHLRSYSMKIIM